MKFSDEIRVPVGDNGEIVLREPAAREINDFNKAAYPIKRTGLDGNADTVKARVLFFDSLFVRVTGCEDDLGDIPEEGKERVPDRIKNDVILKYVEHTGIDVKNS